MIFVLSKLDRCHMIFKCIELFTKFPWSRVPIADIFQTKKRRKRQVSCVEHGAELCIVNVSASVLQTQSPWIQRICCEWDVSNEKTNIRPKIIISHIIRDQKSIYTVDEFWLSANCLSDFNTIWIHENEKNPWKESEDNCSCVAASSVPGVRCGDVIVQFMF